MEKQYSFPLLSTGNLYQDSTDTNIHGSSSPLYNGEVQFVFHICRFCICEQRVDGIGKDLYGQDTDKKVVWKSTAVYDIHHCLHQHVD